MATPPFLNLNPEDIPQEAAEWMTPLIDAINQFAKQVQYCFNRELTFADNFKAYWKTVDIRKFPYKFANTVNFKPMGIFIASAYDITNPTNPKPFAAAGLAYSFGGSDVLIDSIGGTVTDGVYRVTFLVIGN
jgi:hypothetical protein